VDGVSAEFGITTDAAIPVVDPRNVVAAKAARDEIEQIARRGRTRGKEHIKTLFEEFAFSVLSETATIPPVWTHVCRCCALHTGGLSVFGTVWSSS
jgi:hypothetical protein